MYDWRQHAACRGLGPDLFYPDSPGRMDQTGDATALCRTCPVIGDCLRYALDRHEPDGVWGGTSAMQRRRIRHARRHQRNVA